MPLAWPWILTWYFWSARASLGACTCRVLPAASAVAANVAKSAPAIRGARLRYRPGRGLGRPLIVSSSGCPSLRPGPDAIRPAPSGQTAASSPRRPREVPALIQLLRVGQIDAEH